MWRVPITRIWLLILWLAAGLCALVTIIALGLFPETLETPISNAWERFKQFLMDNGTALDQLWKVLGGVATILSGCWAIYKSWRYAESNLPKRIEEFLEKSDERLEKIRPLLLANIEAPQRNLSQRAPMALVGPLNDALRAVRFGRVAGLDANLEKSIDLLTKQKLRWAEYDAQLNKQLVASLMMQGVALATQAGFEGRSAGRDKDQKAFDRFNEAVKLSPKDPEPLYYRARQSIRLGQGPMARADFQRIAHLTQGQLCVIRTRAAYLEARLLTETANPAWHAALSLMRTCVESCPEEFRHTEEYGEMNEFRGIVQENHPNNYVQAAVTSYQAAATIFAPLNSSRSREGLARVQDALSRLG